VDAERPVLVVISFAGVIQEESTRFLRTRHFLPLDRSRAVNVVNT